jgi:hypothetical protein
MYVNAKLIPAETVPGIRRRGMEERKCLCVFVHTALCAFEYLYWCKG